MSAEEENRPYAVIILRAFGELPKTGAFSLMCSGFLTDGKSIRGDTISHIQEEKIREILAMDNEEQTGTKVTITAYNPISYPDHRLAIEDLVRILPLDGHCLLELCTLPSECVERIIRILIASKRRVLIYRVIRENSPDHIPRSKEDLYRIRSSTKEASVVFESESQERFVHTTQEEYDLVCDELNMTIGYLNDLGAKTETLVYNPHDKLVHTGSRVCELLTKDHIRLLGNERIMYDPKDLITDYLTEYPNGGSLNEYTITNPIRKGFVNEIVPEKWLTRETDTLIVEPMSVSNKDKTMNVTSHTEIIIQEQDIPPFVPLTWHRGDMRTIQIHHEPLSTSLRVL